MSKIANNDVLLALLMVYSIECVGRGDGYNDRQWKIVVKRVPDPVLMFNPNPNPNPPQP